MPVALGAAGLNRWLAKYPLFYGEHQLNLQSPRRAKAKERIRVAVIGAGASGIAAAKCLLEEGLEPIVFEQSSEIGGVWKYAEELPAGGGIAYRSLKTNTSKRMLAFSDFPFPPNAADFPSRAEVLQYLNEYVDHFGLRKFIAFNSAIERVKPHEDGKWMIHCRAEKGATTAQSYDAVIVASGLYHRPIYPAIPGIQTFQGQRLHSADYKGPEGLEGKRVVIIGVGASGADIAAEVSQVAERVELSTRAGVWFLPHDIGGKPYDYQLTRLSTMLPFRARMFLFRQLVLNAYKQMGFTDKEIARGLSLPEFDVWRARLTPGTPVLKQVLSGAVGVRPEVIRIEAEGVRFADGGYSPADTIIFCTGFALNFPFLDSSIVKVDGDTVELYKHVFHPRLPNLAFLGLCIVNGPLFPVAEMQARWVARAFAGAIELPPPSVRMQAVERHRSVHRQLAAHPMRVQLIDYMDELALQINAKPRPFRHPQLIPQLLLGPLVAAQYRLDGVGKTDRASEIISAS